MKKRIKNRKHQQRKWMQPAGWLVAAALIAVNYSPLVQDIVQLPSQLRVFGNSGQTLNLESVLPLQWTSEDESLVAVESGNAQVTGSKLCVVGETGGTTQLKAKLFGITVKNVAVEVEPEYYVNAGGQPIGIALYTKGLMVAGFTQIKDPLGEYISR